MRYLFAVAAFLAAFSLRLVLDPLMHARSPLLLFGLAITASAIRGGFGPGVLAMILGVIGAVYFFPPRSFVATHYLPAVLQLLTFVLVGFILSWLSGELLSLRWQALRLADRLQATLAERDSALTHVRLLSGLQPISAGCKKIREEQERWQQLETYISNHSEPQFSHGLCPDCADRYLKDLHWSIAALPLRLFSGR